MKYMGLIRARKNAIIRMAILWKTCALQSARHFQVRWLEFLSTFCGGFRSAGVLGAQLPERWFPVAIGTFRFGSVTFLPGLSRVYSFGVAYERMLFRGY